MTIEQIINDEVYNTESGQKLLKLLSKIIKNKCAAENLIVILKTEENRQKMIKFLKSEKRSGDEAAYFAAFLNNKEQV